MTRVAALIVAAGNGSRAGQQLPKQYSCVGGKSVLAHAIDALAAHPAIEAIQVVIGEGQSRLYAEAVADRSLLPPVTGGAARRDSVMAGLRAIDAEIVLVHDAARPFLPPAVIDRLLQALETHEGAVPGLPVADTLTTRDGTPVPREGLMRVQTPQAFRRAALVAAHQGWDAAHEATDDAQMVRATGGSVAIVEGAASLEKLTYPEDFMAAEARLAPQMISRTALGFDVHAFAEGDGVWLGGVHIPHTRTLAGHSDADVALHALTDALLGTIGEGDIGSHFPPSDPQWRGAASHLFLTHAVDLVKARGGRIDHVDVTIICEEPKVGPHRPAIRARIAALLGLQEMDVSIKATTTEKLGFTGRREGIAAQAAASVRLPERAK